MDDIQLLVTDTARRVLGKHVTPDLHREAPSGALHAAFWADLEAAELHRMTRGEAHGGAGLPAETGLAVIHIFAAFAAPGPFAETLLASWIAARAGFDVPDGPMTLAFGGDDLRLVREAGGWRLTGVARDVPWGRDASILLVTEHDNRTAMALLPARSAQCNCGLNIAGEPRDNLAWRSLLPADAVIASVEALTLRDCRALGAATRAMQMAGAGERVCQMTVEHVRQRVQFGKTLASFQAIQQSLAQIATAAAASSVAAGRAMQAFELRTDGWMAAAIGKIRAGEAAGLIARLAHQLHGAIGFTEEYQLHQLTKRLWAWRNEFGSETYWAQSYGKSLIAAGADQLWLNIVKL